MADRSHLVVATPCYGGLLTSVYVDSLLKLQSACRARGVDFEWLLLGGDALITRARADLVAHFLDRPGATHLLFIDADIGFEPDQVFRLMSFEAEMTAAVYPTKRLDWPRIREAVARGEPRPETAALGYVFEVADPARIVARGGFALARYAGTGFLMIRRGALLKLIAAHPELKYQRAHTPGDPLRDSPHRFALFDCLIDPETGVYLSEDFAFCRRWTALGGEIWVDVESRLTHVGPHAFVGDFSTQFNPAAP
jgi:hypothetical protein